MEWKLKTLTKKLCQEETIKHISSGPLIALLPQKSENGNFDFIKKLLLTKTTEMAGCKILIIDDDTDDVEILHDAFVQSGVENVHYVHSALDAFMFLEQVQAEEELPKLIVTDAFLPGISGAEFLADLKEMDRYKHIHVVVLSTVKSEKEIEKYRLMGAQDYLTKPSSYDEYVKVAKKIAERVALT
ncbi:MAG: two-component response regulator [Segetibacter sp.]|nr:two-component response regulator [Segetibacter sp.]